METKFDSDAKVTDAPGSAGESEANSRRPLTVVEILTARTKPLDNPFADLSWSTAFDHRVVEQVRDLLARACLAVIRPDGFSREEAKRLREDLTFGVLVRMTFDEAYRDTLESEFGVSPRFDEFRRDGHLDDPYWNTHGGVNALADDDFFRLVVDVFGLHRAVEKANGAKDDPRLVLTPPSAAWPITADHVLNAPPFPPSREHGRVGVGSWFATLMYSPVTAVHLALMRTGNLLADCGEVQGEERRFLRDYLTVDVLYAMSSDPEFRQQVERHLPVSARFDDLRRANTFNPDSAGEGVSALPDSQFFWLVVDLFGFRAAVDDATAVIAHINQSLD